MVRMRIRLPRKRETSKPRRYTLSVAMKGSALAILRIRRWPFCE